MCVYSSTADGLDQTDFLRLYAKRAKFRVVFLQHTRRLMNTQSMPCAVVVAESNCGFKRTIHITLYKGQCFKCHTTVIFVTVLPSVCAVTELQFYPRLRVINSV